jgi:MFS-type transporter involved in bile tolerance (Atg22 family)
MLLSVYLRKIVSHFRLFCWVMITTSLTRKQAISRCYLSKITRHGLQRQQVQQYNVLRRKMLANENLQVFFNPHINPCEHNKLNL